MTFEKQYASSLADGGAIIPSFNVIAVKFVDYHVEMGIFPNLSLTLKIKVMMPKAIGILRHLWASYIPSFNLIAVVIVWKSEFSDRWTHERTDRQTPP